MGTPILQRVSGLLGETSNTSTNGAGKHPVLEVPLPRIRGDLMSEVHLEQKNRCKICPQGFHSSPSHTRGRVRPTVLVL